MLHTGFPATRHVTRANSAALHPRRQFALIPCLSLLLF
jgi:hypothetical protein